MRKNYKGGLSVTVAVLMVISLLVISCGGSKGGLEKKTKASLQTKMENEAPYKDYGILVGAVKLVKSGTYTYKGTATMTVNGQSHEVIIDVVSDGRDAVWSIEPLAFAFLTNAPKTTLRAGLTPNKSAKKSVKPSEPNERTDFKYDLNETKDGVVILQYVGTRGDVVVPAEIDGFPVVSIAEEAFKDCKNIVVVTLPDTLRFIGDSSFSNCQSLVSIDIPDSVTYIGRWALTDCASLSSIVLPNSIESIERATFSGCSLLTSIKIPESVEYIFYKAFINCSNLLTVELPSHPLKYISGNSRAENDLYSVEYDGDAVHRYARARVQNFAWGQYRGFRWEEESEITLANLKDTVEINDFKTYSNPVGNQFTARDNGGNTYVYSKSVEPKYSIAPNSKNEAFTGCFRLDLQMRQKIAQSGYEGDFN
ncbi:MAG: hypothetical protein Ta2B_08860 [Termitinemataceae bacterium]|nr:MAG: hypothetical protein Ta2B_08860 [Termitinemataceae bacterium]